MTLPVMTLNKLVSSLSKNHPDVPLVSTISETLIDHERWYSIKCHALVSQWIQKHPNDLWRCTNRDYANCVGYFELNEKLYLTVRLITS